MTNNYFKSKYENKNFEERLIISDALVKKIARYLVNIGYIVRVSDDSQPFVMPNNSMIRGLDIFCAKDGRALFIDAKDYPKLRCYNATGIPLNIYRRYLKIEKEFGINTMIFFVEDEKSEPYGGFMSEFKKFHKQDIPHKGQKKDGTIYFSSQILWDIDSMKPLSKIF